MECLWFVHTDDMGIESNRRNDMPVIHTMTLTVVEIGQRALLLPVSPSFVVGIFPTRFFHQVDRIRRNAQFRVCERYECKQRRHNPYSVCFLLWMKRTNLSNDNLTIQQQTRQAREISVSRRKLRARSTDNKPRTRATVFAAELVRQRRFVHSFKGTRMAFCFLL